MAAGRESEALPVIAARGGDDPGRIRPLALQPVEIDQPAPHLEGADRRVVLVLDHDIGAEPLRQQRPRMRRRRRHRLPDDLVCAFEFGEIKHFFLHPLACSSSPRRRGSSIPETPENNPSRRGVLDRPVKPGDDSGIGVHPSILTPAPCRRRRPRRWLRRSPPPATAFHCAPCRTESSGSSFRAPRRGNRTAPGA